VSREGVNGSGIGEVHREGNGGTHRVEPSDRNDGWNREEHPYQTPVVAVGLRFQRPAVDPVANGSPSHQQTASASLMEHQSWSLS
jgi:hypothetical protein